jgi:uncharacterized membrane protein
MSDRVLKVALAASVLTNAFLGAVAIAGAIYFSQALNQGVQQGQHTPLAAVAQDLDPDLRVRLKRAMRAVALTAAPDFNEAHEARRKAADLASAPVFDRAAAESELIHARAAEERGRARMETGLLDFMQAQSPAARATLAKALRARASLRMAHGDKDGPHGPPEAPPPGPPPG